MMELTQLAVGRPYPFKLAPYHDGAATQFLLKGGNVLQILITKPSSDEIWSMKKGTIKAGFLYENSSLLWLFRFLDKKDKPVLDFDCPFDVRIIPRDDLALHSIENEKQRLAIEIHVVDEKHIVRALRLVTLSPKMTIDFLSAVQRQMASVQPSSEDNKWTNYSIDELNKVCNNMEKLGQDD